MHYLWEENNRDLVVSPTDYQKELDSVKEGALYGDSYFPKVNEDYKLLLKKN